MDKDEDSARRSALRWWDADATTFRKAAIGMDDRLEELPGQELPRDFRYFGSWPVLFGHYWMNGEPVITAPNAGCFDFSVATKGYLTAYRWSGERELSLNNLTHVPAVQN